MSKEMAEKFLDDYKANRELAEKVEKIFEDHPDMTEEDLWLLAAKECGYDFTPEELEAAFHEREQAADEIEKAKLDREELRAVAGGGDNPLDQCEHDFVCMGSYRYFEEKHPNCKDTFKNGENCWHNDGCDNIYHMYHLYLCHYSGECANAFTHR